MNTWDACEQSWKNGFTDGYEKGTHDIARYVAHWLGHISTMDKDDLYAAIINDFKNRKEEETNV